MGRVLTISLTSEQESELISHHKRNNNMEICLGLIRNFGFSKK